MFTHLGDFIVIALVYHSDLVTVRVYKAWVDFLLANTICFDVISGWLGNDLGFRCSNGVGNLLCILVFVIQD